MNARRHTQNRTLARSSIVLVSLGAGCSLGMGCNVESTAPDASGAGDAGASGRCPRGYVVVHSDYASTNLSVVGADGTLRTPSLLSSGSTSAGLSAPLSGDVAVPVERALGAEVVAIDRYPGSVLTWVNVETAQVRAQLNVGEGFAANPHDVLTIDESKAYVTRYEANPNADEAALDRGEDILVIDPKSPKVVSRIALRRPGDGVLSPRPDRMLRVGAEVWVTAQRMNADFTEAGLARIVGIDAATDSIAWTLDVPQVKNCGLMVRSPDGSKVAVTCSGQYYTGPNQFETSALVVLDPATSPPTIEGAHHIASSIGGPLGASIDFATPTKIIGTAVGDLDANRNDSLFVFDLESKSARVIVAASRPFVLGDVRCAPGCGAPCLVTDAEHAGVYRIDVDGESLADPVVLPVDDGTPLPPRALGAL